MNNQLKTQTFKPSWDYKYSPLKNKNDDEVLTQNDDNNKNPQFNLSKKGQDEAKTKPQFFQKKKKDSNKGKWEDLKRYKKSPKRCSTGHDSRVKRQENPKDVITNTIYNPNKTIYTNCNYADISGDENIQLTSHSKGAFLKAKLEIKSELNIMLEQMKTTDLPIDELIEKKRILKEIQKKTIKENLKHSKGILDIKAFQDIANITTPKNKTDDLLPDIYENLTDSSKNFDEKKSVKKNINKTIRKNTKKDKKNVKSITPSIKKSGSREPSFHNLAHSRTFSEHTRQSVLNIDNKSRNLKSGKSHRIINLFNLKDKDKMSLHAICEDNTVNESNEQFNSNTANMEAFQEECKNNKISLEKINQMFENFCRS